MDPELLSMQFTKTPALLTTNSDFQPKNEKWKLLKVLFFMYNFSLWFFYFILLK
jgi:hypothetical protein